MTKLEQLQAEYEVVRDERDRQYWLFARRANGKPVDRTVSLRYHEALEAVAAERRRLAKVEADTCR